MQQLNHGAIGLRARVQELAQNQNAKVVVIGVAAVALTPVILPLMKPVLKATIKTGFSLFEKTKSAIAETGEILADIAAEAKAEAILEAQNKATQATVLPASQANLSEN